MNKKEEKIYKHLRELDFRINFLLLIMAVLFIINISLSIALFFILK